MEEQIDPIYGNIINENDAYTIGKTKYSLNSLYEWFIVRKNFINPMSNTNMNQEEIRNFIEKIKLINLFPNVPIDKMPVYKIMILLEKHHTYQKIMTKNIEKINKLKKWISQNEEKMDKIIKKNGEENIQTEKHRQIIKKMELQIQKIELNLEQNKKSLESN